MGYGRVEDRHPQGDHGATTQLAGYFDGGEGIVPDHHGFDSPALAEVGPPAGELARRFRKCECGHRIAHLGHHQAAELEKTKVAGYEEAALSIAARILDVLNALF